MSIKASFNIMHKDHPPSINILVTGNNLQELKNQAEKFAQDFALLKGYSPSEMSVKIIGSKDVGNTGLVTLDRISNTQ